MSGGTGDLSSANKELETLRGDKESLQDDKYKLGEEHSYQQVMGELLRDQGIKSKIIKQYLPVINQLTNQYLQTLDFFVHFDLDEHSKRPYVLDTEIRFRMTHSQKVRNNVLTYRCCSLGDRLPR